MRSNNDGRRRRGNGRGRGNNRRGRQWGGRRGGRHNGDPRAAAHSGNKRERIAVESGFLVLIDQFMLANPQFIDRLAEVIDEEPSVKDELILEYGGAVVELAPGTYRIDRDPYAYTIVIHPEGERIKNDEVTELASDEGGNVFVDTRCLAMVDRELLDDSGLLEKYKQLWFSGQEKACRDLLRDNGGAVRYGFKRFGDELGVYSIPDQEVVCLWPDAEAVEAAEAASA